MYSVCRSIEGKGEEIEDCVRMKVFMGRFVVEDLGKAVRITHLSLADPMGMIPDFVKNMAINKQAGRPAQIY
jgi:hypothetical protein